MTDPADHAAPRRLADLAPDARRALDTEKQRELDEGLTRRHLANAAEEQSYAAAQFARALRLGPTLAAKLRGG